MTSWSCHLAFLLYKIPTSQNNGFACHLAIFRGLAFIFLIIYFFHIRNGLGVSVEKVDQVERERG